MKVKHQWSCTSSPLYAFMVCTGTALPEFSNTASTAKLTYFQWEMTRTLLLVRKWPWSILKYCSSVCLNAPKKFMKVLLGRLPLWIMFGVFTLGDGKKLPSVRSGEWCRWLLFTMLRFARKCFTDLAEWVHLWNSVEQTNFMQIFFYFLPSLHEESDILPPS